MANLKDKLDNRLTEMEMKRLESQRGGGLLGGSRIDYISSATVNRNEYRPKNGVYDSVYI